MVYPLTIEGTYNIRDLGGFGTANGAITRTGVFIRAGNLDKLPESSQQQLIDYGVNTVIDLRDEWEVQQFPNVFNQSPKVHYVNLPLIGDHLSHSDSWQAMTENYSRLDELYIKYIDNCQAQIGTIMTTLAEGSTTVIFHCYAGKDRTGIIAALLLATVGVPTSQIAEDYAASSAQITHLVEQWRDYARQHGRDMKQLERDAASTPETITNMLAHLEQKYGSVEGYLHACQVTDSHFAQLKSKFIQAN